MTQFFAGEVPPASKLNSLRPVFARKTADETVNNSAVFQNDNELFVTVEADAVYVSELHLVQNSGTTPDFKYQFTFPAGTTMPSGYLICGPSSSFQAAVTGASGGATGIFGQASNSPLKSWGLVITSSTAGTLQLQWAQNTATASDTIVRAGSFLVLYRVA